MLHRLPILLWLVVLCSTAFAQERDDSVRIQESDRYDLVPYIRVLEDKTGALTIDQVSGPENQRFVENTDATLNFGITPYTYWLEVSIVGPSLGLGNNLRADWYLEVGRALLNVAELYVSRSNANFEMQTADTRKPFDERAIYHVNSVFPISIVPGENLTLYLKVTHPRSPLYLPVVLWEPEAFLQKIAIEEFLYGLFYGGVLVLVVYNLFIYFTVRDRSYIYYVGYLLMVTMYQLLQSGHGVLHALPLYDVITVNALASILWVVYIFVVLFLQAFLEIKKYHPKINFILNIVLIFFATNVFLAQYFTGTVAVQFAGVSPLYLTPIVISVGYYSWRQGNENGKFYLFSWFPVVAVAAFNSLVLTGVLTSQITITEIITPVSFIMEAVILSFALANRIKISQEFLLISNIEKERNLHKYRSIFENSLQGLYRMTMEGRIVSANLAFIKIFGEQEGSGGLDENKRMARAMFVDGMSDYGVMREGKTVENNVVISTKGGGDDVFVTHSAKIVFDDFGLPSHIEGGVVDDTELHRRMKAVVEREKERVKNKVAQEVMEGTNQFLFMMSHHIRTPLTAIIGYGELLQDGDNKDDQRNEWVETVVHNSHSLLKLINNILDYSKIEAGKFEVESIDVNVVDVISEMTKEFSSKAISSGLNFDVIYGSAIPDKIIGDPARISLVLRNLCDNAFKYTRRGKVVLRLEWDEHTEQLSFSVKDTGVGISHSALRSLFYIGSEKDESYSSPGLSLIVSKKLSMLMGGDILVESSLGEGSEFTFVTGRGLPTDVCWIKANELIEVPHQRGIRKSGNVSALVGTVLLAEDNVVNQKFIARVLKKTGVSVVIANDGVEACECCDQALPDFVLMDINMPNRDGVEATTYLRGKGYDMPIYALTAETDREDIDRMLNAGCQGFLTKPLNRDELNKILNEYLGDY